MKYGICKLAVVPMRSSASDKSELINQILYGETFDLIEIQEKWTKVCLHHDGYEGWVDNKQYAIATQKYNPTNILTKKLIYKNNQYYSIGSFVDFKTSLTKQSIINTAKLFLNVPYLWGGRSIFGTDCSGFVQLVFRVHGVGLPRDAYQQAEVGQLTNFENSATNDLAFFANDIGKIIHVGIIIKNKKNTKIIHASGKVRIDSIDKKGIYNEEAKLYSHQLHSIRRAVTT